MGMMWPYESRQVAKLDSRALVRRKWIRGHEAVGELGDPAPSVPWSPQKTSTRAPQKPRAPAPPASSGARSPRPDQDQTAEAVLFEPKLAVDSLGPQYP